MVDEFHSRMREVCNQMLEEELKVCDVECEITLAAEGKKEYPALPGEKQVTELAEKILALLLPDQNLFYFHYCFHIPDQKVEKILGVSQAFEQRIYLERVLAAFMNVGEAAETEAGKTGPEKLGIEKKFIEKTVMEAACKKALADYSAYDGAELSGFPVYSGRFRKKLKKIHAAQKTQGPVLIFVRRAAVFLLVLTLGLSGAMVTNAEFRQRVAEWFVETFPEFTRFRILNPAHQSTSEIEEYLERFEIEYIPQGFFKTEKYAGKAGQSWYYSNEQAKRIIIKITPGNAVSSFDTEEAEVKTTILNGGIAYYWNENSKLYMVWQIEEFCVNIISDMDYNEVYKIAQSIRQK